MRLQSTGQKNGNKYALQLGTVFLAVIMAVATLGCLMSIFGITIGQEGIFGGGLSGGMIRAWNTLADTLGDAEYILLKQLEGESDGSGLFLLLVGLVLAAFNYAVLRGKKLLLLLYLIPFFLVQLLFDVKPSMVMAAGFICAIVVAIIYHLYPGKGKVVGTITTLVIVGAITAIGFLISDEIYERPQLVDNFDKGFQSGVRDLRYGTNIRGDGSLQPVDFQSKEIALELKMENPDSLYLRGFIGSNYNEGRWDTLANSDYYGQRSLFYGLNKDGFSGLTQLSIDSELLREDRESGQVEVTSKGASRNYIYTPYELVDSSIEDTKNWADSFLTSEKLTGSKSYQFTVKSNMVEDWPSLTGELFSQKKNDALDQYRLLESYYNVQVYEDYNYLSSAQKKLLNEYFGFAGNQDRGHVDYKAAIKRVNKFLKENFLYTENIKEREEPLDTFLETRKGCDVDFATTATLLYRYYGIPARYVEGYIVKPEDVKGKAKGATIQIPATNNHAWTEIYVDSFGWVPIESTPEYYDQMAQPDLSKGLEDQSKGDDFKEKQNRQQQNIEEIAPGKEKDQVEKPWWLILVFLAADLILATVIAFLVWLILITVKRWKRRRSFRQKDVRKAICAIYGYMLKRELQLSERTREIGDRAAFSPHDVSGQDRQFMLEELKRMVKRKNEKKIDSYSHGDAPAPNLRRVRGKRRRR